jgi:NAD(P)-dependent dehydrogenase (short-subunit alcohol dehydrogenase family)
MTMADAGIGEAIAVAGILASVGTAVYSSEQAKKLAPKTPQMPVAPKEADVTSLESSQAQAQRQAETAGGTILSNPSDNKRNIGTAVQPPKTLLGA